MTCSKWRAPWSATSPARPSILRPADQSLVVACNDAILAQFGDLLPGQVQPFGQNPIRIRAEFRWRAVIDIWRFGKPDRVGDHVDLAHPGVLHPAAQLAVAKRLVFDHFVKAEDGPRRDAHRLQLLL